MLLLLRKRTSGIIPSVTGCSTTATISSVVTVTSSLSSLHISAPTSSPNSLLSVIKSRTVSHPHNRGFCTSSPHLTKTIELRGIPDALVPPYPYGHRTVYKQSNNGLYGNSRVRTGNVSTGKDVIKCKRTWRPNVQEKRFWSPALRAWVRTRMTLRVFRTIRNVGGIENYVLGEKPARIRELGPGGWRLRWLILQTELIRNRMDQQRRDLGLEEPVREAPIVTNTSSELLSGADNGAPGLAPVELQPKDNAQISFKQGMLGVAMDYATPGKISKRSRDAVDAYLAQIIDMEEFGIGPESELLSDTGLTREGSRLADVCDREQQDKQQKQFLDPAREVGFVAAGQAIQVRNMAAKIKRRNHAVASSSKSLGLKRRFKGR